MPDSANQSNVSDAVRPPDYRKAVVLIRTIDAKKDKIASVNGEIGDVWGKVEGVKVHKKAGKFFASIDKLEGPERLDVIRSLNGLMGVAGWPEVEADLVDQAEGTEVRMRLGEGFANMDEADGDDDGDEPEPEPATTSPRRRGRPSAIDKIEAARAHLGGAAPDAFDPPAPPRSVQ